MQQSNTRRAHLRLLIEKLTQRETEAEWFEFKVNNEDPHQIGEYISALANSTAILGRPAGYVIWGVDNTTHEIVGTDFTPQDARRGGEELEPWLLRSLQPQLNFSFIETSIDEKRVVILRIPRATHRPIAFFGEEYIRVGSYKKKLRDTPEKERALWRAFDNVPFEKHIALDGLEDAEVTTLLDYPAYFDLTDSELPPNRNSILASMEDEGFITKGDDGLWAVTNLGAILFAKKLADFSSLSRKAARVILYRDNGRTDPIKEQIGTKGYAAGFKGMLGYISNFIPSNEVVGQAIRADLPMYPPIAIRELVANAIIHQDFGITGAGPMIEIFTDRIEISNPGRPLLPVDRLLDKPPRSRNESLASFMRRVGMCEERGSGIDRVVASTESYQLPAPEFMEADDSFRATLFAHRPYAKMDRADKVRACYLHACLRYVLRDYMTNTSLRERFGIAQANSAIVSRLIKEAVDMGLICPHDENSGKRFVKYVPSWAKRN
ncbi:ATP-binding protein [Bordetella avium]|uniref:Hypothetical phage protein n=1 Tax=Bordetella avium (strain 197N) TaxID=360910 RepID=Q2KZ74_BORA1|nr:ATP-binding protein [Bordetella avium]RIQ53586.1 transcriptional regulator [Bordetella avium]CAJ48010.1 Hypothetical phage protein [Bordetella avium 197N]